MTLKYFPFFHALIYYTWAVLYKRPANHSLHDSASDGIIVSFQIGRLLHILKRWNFSETLALLYRATYIA